MIDSAAVAMSTAETHARALDPRTKKRGAKALEALGGPACISIRRRRSTARSKRRYFACSTGGCRAAMRRLPVQPRLPGPAVLRGLSSPDRGWPALLCRASTRFSIGSACRRSTLPARRDWYGLRAMQRRGAHCLTPLPRKLCGTAGGTQPATNTVIKDTGRRVRAAFGQKLRMRCDTRVEGLQAFPSDTQCLTPQ